MTLSKNDSKKLAVAAARAGDAKHAAPVSVVDLAGRSSLADFAVLLTVDSAPQLDAVEDEVLIRLKQDGSYCLYKDGMRSKNWKVLDYGGVLVHIFDAKTGEYYSIEKLYSEYKQIPWQEKAAAPADKPAAVKKPAIKKEPAKKTRPVKKVSGKSAPKKAAVKKTKSAKKAAKPAKKKPAVKKNSAKK